jgi:fumarate hydratase class I
MDLFRLVTKAFEKTEFKIVDTGEEKPRFEGGRLFIPPAMLRRAAEEGFRELAFFLRESHLGLLAGRLKDPELSANDRLAIRLLLKNAISAAGGEFALCQDTGTAVIYGWKEERVFTGADDREALEAGAAGAYKKNYLRSSQTGAYSFFDEFNTGDNLPAQVHIESVPSAGMGPEASPPGGAYRFLFLAKGGGSSNKTGLFPMTKALLEKGAFEQFLEEKIRALGTAACPPYRLAIVVGGTSPELNLEVLKFATAEALDAAPFFTEGEDAEKARGNWIRRDAYWEKRAMEIGRAAGLGAQFGGPSLLLDARVLRLPRHAASCPVSIGVSCVAHRNLYAFIDREGLHIERLCSNPAAFLKGLGFSPDLNAGKEARDSENAARINLDRPIKEVCRELSAFKAGDRLLLSGRLLVARDAAHLKWRRMAGEGQDLPEYLFKYPVYYAGPAATPPGRIIGSLGPTTAGRMDGYAEEFMSRGASLVTVAKGNRSAFWRESCRRYGGFYLGTIGGAAALLAGEHVTANELIDYPELGMEAVRLITVRDLPAFIIIDDKGGDLYPDSRGSFHHIS